MTILRAPFVVLLASAWLIPAAGCYESHDAPPGTRRDGGGASQQLDGASTADGASSDGASADAASLDGAARDARPDGSRIDSGRAECGDIVPMYEGTGCSDATRACIATCPAADPACPDECISRDAECSFCVNQTFIRCANESGCQDAWDTFACCAHEEPSCATFAGLELLACPRDCDGELIEYDACFRALGGSCMAEVVPRCGLEL